MTIGAGLAPAGTSLAGYGAPTTYATPGTVIYPDVVTGIMQTGRLINPLTKDYTYTLDGRVCGERTVPQLVKLALMTVYKSACTDLGIDFSAIQMKTQTFKRDMNTAISNALASLVAQQFVTIKKITITDIPQDAVLAVVIFIDNTTGIQHTQTVTQQ
jgi:hypothetical protein